MTDYYVDNAAGTSTSPYSTWATAAHYISTIAALDAAGDTVYVASSHAETSAAAQQWAWAGTSTAPTRIICADKTSGEPPTVIATGASISTTANNVIRINDGAKSFYCYGLHFSCGSASTSVTLSMVWQSNALSYSVFERCRFFLKNQASAGNVGLLESGSGDSTLIMKDCEFQVAHVNQDYSISPANCKVYFIGGKTVSTTPDPFVTFNNQGNYLEMSGFDCSSMATAFNFAGSNFGNTCINIRNSKLPNSWSGTINSSLVPPNSVFQLMNTDNQDTNYRLFSQQGFGQVVHETTIVKTGGASDGVTPISWAVSSRVSAEWNHQTVNTPEIVRWVTTVGSAMNVGVDIISGVTSLNNHEIWLDIEYLGTSGRPLSLFQSNASTYISISSYHANSAANWTSTGLTSSYRQLLSTTFTPQEIGFMHGIVRLAASSYTVYVDPVLQVI